MLSIWVQGDDPAGALAAAKSLPLGVGADKILESVFDQWSRKDATAAWASAGQLGDVRVRFAVQNLIIRNLADSDAKAAFDLLRGLPGGNPDPNSYGNVFRQWATQAPDEALAALKNLPVGTSAHPSFDQFFCQLG